MLYFVVCVEKGVSLSFSFRTGYVFSVGICSVECFVSQVGVVWKQLSLCEFKSIKGIGIGGW